MIAVFQRPAFAIGFVVGMVAFLLAMFCRWRFSTRKAGPTRPAPTPSPKPTKPEAEDSGDDEDWPDTWEMWRWYIGAREAAHGAGINATMQIVTYQDHVALQAAQAIGQMEGAKLRANPAADVPLLTVKTLDDKVWGLLREDEDAPTTTAADPVPTPADATDKGTMGLWRKSGVPGGKYLVLRRDGSVFEHPCFVLGARDPVAPTALLAYARQAEILGLDAQFVADVARLVEEFDAYREKHGAGDPDAKPHRKDDPATVAKMAEGGSA